MGRIKLLFKKILDWADKNSFAIRVVFPILFFLCILFEATGITDVAWHGFGVDSAGKVYVGHYDKVFVYENGKKTDSIDLWQYGVNGDDLRTPFRINVTENDELVVAVLDNKYTLDLRGELISSSKDPEKKLYKALEKKVTAEVEGRRYEQKQFLGFYWITDENGDLIFTRNLVDTLFVLIQPALMICFLIWGYCQLKEVLERKKNWEQS